MESFKNAHHFTVNGGQFTTNIGEGDSVSTILWKQASAAAIFDSADRYPAGKCHPGTRQRIINKITEWMNDPISSPRILWLHGLAGTGKSALAQTICELLRDSGQPDEHTVSASFFFSRGPTDRGNATKLFTTLAYQLALQIPAIRKEINETLRRDPSVLTKSMEIQLWTLIVQPLLSCGDLPPRLPLIIIDGLDECADDDGDVQQNIIHYIAKSIVEYNIPLRFMIASRPESWIRDAFAATPPHDITLVLSLREDLYVSQDIRTYLTDGFETIRTQNQRVLASVPLPWPPTDVIDRFVYEASGQYIYASTILRFVGKHSRFSNPQEQLRILTSPSPQRALAFSELDRLYVTILASYPRWDTMKRVLGGILFTLNATTIEVALKIDPVEFELVLDALSSVINVNENDWENTEYGMSLEAALGSPSAASRTVSFSHLSFREFLEDETRSGPFHVETREVGDEIKKAFLSVLQHNGYEEEMAPYDSVNIELMWLAFCGTKYNGSERCRNMY